MKHFAMKSLAVAALAVIAAPSHAQIDLSNTMTNIVSVAAGCDIAAIGIDFGVITTIPAGGQVAPTATANTTTGSALTANAGVHPDASADGAGGLDQDSSNSTNNDALSLTTPVGVVNGVLNTVIAAIPLVAPGVFVVCTVTPNSITLTSNVAGGAAAAPLPLTTGGPVNVASNLEGVGGGAVDTDIINYTMAFTPVVVNTPAVAGVTVFSGVYAATGRLLGPTNPPVGFYTDVVTATVNF